MATVLTCCPSCTALAAPHATWCSLCFTSLIEPEPETPSEPDLAPDLGMLGERADDEAGPAADLDFSALQSTPTFGRWSGADLSVGAKLAIGGLGMLLLTAVILGGLTVIGVLFL